MDVKDEFNFQFDELQPEEPRADHDEHVAPAAPIKRLTCSCPKCGAEVETPFPEKDQETFTATCTACNSMVAIVRESSANRARRRSQKLSCAICGNPLDHHIHCTSCGAFFPDYHVAVNQQDMRRTARSKRLADFRHSLERFNPSFHLDFIRKPTEEKRQRRPTITTAPARTLVTPRTLRLVAALLVVALLASGASYAFRLRQQQRQFTKSYFKAVYGIKTSNDYNLKFCTRMMDDWKTASRGSFTPRLSDSEKAMAEKLHDKVDSLIQEMGTPPEKFAQAHQKLIQLRNAYQKSHDLAASPPQTLQALAASADQAESGFKTAAQELKGSMPEAFKDEFEIAKQKYRGMQEF
jgi:hypothetical protein